MGAVKVRGKKLPISHYEFLKLIKEVSIEKVQEVLDADDKVMKRYLEEGIMAESQIGLLMANFGMKAKEIRPDLYDKYNF